MRLAEACVLMVLGVALSACDRGDDLVKHEEAYADKVCACHDSPCLKAALRDEIAWSKTANLNSMKGIAWSDENGRRLVAANFRAKDCLDRLLPTTTAAPAPAAAPPTTTVPAGTASAPAPR